MKWMLFLLAWLPAIGLAQSLQPLFPTPNPAQLRFWQYRPDSLPGQAPTVVVLHGCSMNADLMHRILGWQRLADACQFSLLYPEQPLLNHPQFCFRWYEPGHNRPGGGEFSAILAGLDLHLNTVQGDGSRVYVLGFSAGGAMAAGLLALAPERFRAGAVVAGMPFGSAQDLFSASLAQAGLIDRSPAAWADSVRALRPDWTGPWPKLHIVHGNADAIVDVHNAHELAEQWLALHQTSDSSQAGLSLRVLPGWQHYLPLDTGQCRGQGGEVLSFGQQAGYSLSWNLARRWQLLPPDSILGPDANANWEAPNHPGATYHWTLPDGAMVLTGQGGPEIQSSWPLPGGTIQVIVTDAAGCPADTLQRIWAGSQHLAGPDPTWHLQLPGRQAGHIAGGTRGLWVEIGSAQGQRIWMGQIPAGQTQVLPVTGPSLAWIRIREMGSNRQFSCWIPR